MICANCGTDAVTWRGPLSDLTHTECSRCGGINCQRAEPSENAEDETCPECEGCGWTHYATPGGGGPVFRECDACHNPEELSSP